MPIAQVIKKAVAKKPVSVAQTREGAAFMKHRQEIAIAGKRVASLQKKLRTAESKWKKAKSPTATAGVCTAERRRSRESRDHATNRPQFRRSISSRGISRAH